MPSANVETETKVGIGVGARVGTEVGINVETETGVRAGTGEKTGRAGKSPQQKMEGPFCMINLTLGNLAQGQPTGN